MDSGGGDDDDCGPKTFSNTTGLEVEVLQAFTQRIVTSPVPAGFTVCPAATGFVRLTDSFLRTNTHACQSTVPVAQSETTGSS